MTTAVFDVLDGGPLTTVQDAGRPDWTHLGVPESGAADPWSLAVANLLVGNAASLAALEITLVWPSLAVRTATTIGLAGADLGARIRGGRPLAPGRSHRLVVGDILEMPGDGPTAPSTGSRAYVAIPGGVDVPVVLGSRSTCLAGGFGGLDGRALRQGDEIAAASHAAHSISEAPLRPELVWPAPDSGWLAGGGADRATLRAVAGPAGGLDQLVTREWRVGSAADRVGVRLDGDRLAEGIGGETTTHGVPWGAIQVPPDGRPIILGADHQTTGGYRVVGVVISADLPLLGQLRPGSVIHIVATDRAAALAALEERRAALVAGAAALRDAAGWGALIDSAGG